MCLDFIDKLPTNIIKNITYAETKSYIKKAIYRQIRMHENINKSKKTRRKIKKII